MPTQSLLRKWAIAHTHLGESLPPIPLLFEIQKRVGQVECKYGRSPPNGVWGWPHSRSELSVYSERPNRFDSPQKAGNSKVATAIFSRSLRMNGIKPSVTDFSQPVNCASQARPGA